MYDLPCTQGHCQCSDRQQCQCNQCTRPAHERYSALALQMQPAPATIMAGFQQTGLLQGLKHECLLCNGQDNLSRSLHAESDGSNAHLVAQSRQLSSIMTSRTTSLEIIHFIDFLHILCESPAAHACLHAYHSRQIVYAKSRKSPRVVSVNPSSLPGEPQVIVHCCP